MLATTAAAPPTQQQVQEAERARAAQIEAQRAAEAQAAAAQAEERRLGAARVEAAARLRELESATEAAAARVEALAQRRAAAQARLAARAADIAPLLPLIERLSLYPAETLLAVPMPPEQSVRGVLVLGGIARQLETEAAALRAEQAEVAALQAQLDAEMPKLAAAQAAQAQAEAALDAQIAAAREARRVAEDAGAEAARRAAAEGARATNLRAAIAKIEAERRAAEARAKAEADAAERQKREAEASAARARQEALARPAGPGVGAPRGVLTAPVAGTVVRGFGEPTEAGPAPGLSYAAPPGARVVSPCGGRVVFAEPFRSFGLLLIVDCGGGYHFVLSGFDRLDVQVGQSVQAGEPVGVMPNWDPRGSAPRPSLYVELRRDGQPVNPAPFLRAKS
ncbi:murein hydrolase activator EnvC family protein [Limobrevibacterium gyesilva]|uniref:murein hydrolase activator EnvC family protein n=1 Tax=Limobrevibacterium gyesilva TaxID=2991712 RepID=UPI002226A9B4|nr:peptidoglycan DD-metalloendopeptidase family protein [Limobrevibacterium gyesilva]